MSNHNMDEKNIETNFVDKTTYGEILHLEKLLSSQERVSGHHDEMMFLIVHQVSELWMKLILHELDAAKEDMLEDRLSTSFKKLARVSQIQLQMIKVWDVLSTLTPSEYIRFRDSLGNTSGFQSYQYRLLEFALGYKTDYILKIIEKDPETHAVLEKAFNAPSLYDAAIFVLKRAGFPIADKVLHRDVTKAHVSHESVFNAWKEVYQHHEKYWNLYQLAEKLVDIEDTFQQWRFRHMKTVERIIGFKVGTGGSSGVNYLKKVLDQRFFPELWDLRTEL